MAHVLQQPLCLLLGDGLLPVLAAAIPPALFCHLLGGDGASVLLIAAIALVAVVLLLVLLPAILSSAIAAASSIGARAAAI